MESDNKKNNNEEEKILEKEEIVYLNVGGQLFATTTTTLTLSGFINYYFNLIKNRSKFYVWCNVWKKRS